MSLIVAVLDVVCTFFCLSANMHYKLVAKSAFSWYGLSSPFLAVHMLKY